MAQEFNKGDIAELILSAAVQRDLEEDYLRGDLIENR